MAFSNFDTYKLLDYWRMFMLEDVWRFNQILGRGVPVLPTPVYIQQDRDMISRALTSAANKMAVNLRYPVVPTWVHENIEYGAGFPQQNQPLQLKYGHVQEIGRRASELIQAGVAIVYSDTGGLQVDDTATVTVNTTYDADEIFLFFRTADGAPTQLNENWQIYGENVTVTKVGNVATITAPRALFVSPNLYVKRPYENPNQNVTEINAADSAAAGDFVTSIDVGRVYADTSSAVQLVSDPRYDCLNESCNDNVRNGCARLLNAELGLVQIRGYDSCACYGFPQYVRIWYKAGYPLDTVTGLPDTELLEATVRLANTIMPRKSCPICDVAYDAWYQDSEQEILAQAYVNNPFGTKHGQAEAYRTCLHRALGEGGKFPAPNQRFVW